MGKGWKTPKKIEVSQKKGNVFSKLAKEIFISAKQGGPNPKNNPRLRLAIAKAKAQSCPKDTIERAIKKVIDQKEGKSSFFELFYEGLGPYQSQFIVEALTENKNRTISNLKKIFSKYNGQLTEVGSVLWNFDKMSLVEALHANFQEDKEIEEKIEIEAIEIGAEYVEKQKTSSNEMKNFIFYGPEKDLDLMREKLISKNWDIKKLELCYRPKNLLSLNLNEKAQVQKLYEALLKDDDTHCVYTNIKLN